jgi:ATP synthase subunit 6
MKGTSNSVLSADLPLLSASLTKEVSYFSFLVNRSATFYSLIDFKANWVSSPTTHSSVRNRYSVIFYKGFYDLLNTKSTRFSSNFNYFSQIKAIILDFLSTYSGMANSLNKTFSEIKGSQSFYSFSTKSVKSIYDSSFVPKMNIFVFEAMYETFLGMVKEIIGKDKRSVSFFPIIFSLFLFILISNLAGLAPYGTTVTAYLTTTSVLSLSVIIGSIILAFKEQGIKFMGHFLPSGVPGWLFFLIIPIELLSFLIKIISLAVRLFANMFAGHTLLAVLTGFGWQMMTGGIMIALISPFPVLVVFVLTGLETGVALIQAYVFTILTCLHFDEVLNGH